MIGSLSGSQKGYSKMKYEQKNIRKVANHNHLHSFADMIKTMHPICDKQIKLQQLCYSQSERFFKRHRNEGMNILSNDARRQNCLNLSSHMMNEITVGGNPLCCSFPLRWTHPVVLCKVCSLPFPSLGSFQLAYS